VYKIVPFLINLAEELFIPSSVIYSEAFLTYLSDDVMSEIFNQGIVPFQYFGVPLSGVPPAVMFAMFFNLIQVQLSGISKGKSSSFTGALLPIFS